MHVELKMPSTGIAYLPGLARPVFIDSADLTPENAAELERLVRDVGFFELPATVGRPRIPDARQYTVTVDTGDRRHTVQVAEPIDNPALRALIAFVQAKAKPRPGS